MVCKLAWYARGLGFSSQFRLWFFPWNINAKPIIDSVFKIDFIFMICVCIVTVYCIDFYCNKAIKVNGALVWWWTTCEKLIDDNMWEQILKQEKILMR